MGPGKLCYLVCTSCYLSSHSEFQFKLNTFGVILRSKNVKGEFLQKWNQVEICFLNSHHLSKKTKFKVNILDNIWVMLSSRKFQRTDRPQGNSNIPPRNFVWHDPYSKIFMYSQQCTCGDIEKLFIISVSNLSTHTCKADK